MLVKLVVVVVGSSGGGGGSRSGSAFAFSIVAVTVLIGWLKLVSEAGELLPCDPCSVVGSLLAAVEVVVVCTELREMLISTLPAASK